MRTFKKIISLVSVIAVGLFVIGPSALADATTPGNITATAVSPTEIDLSWAGSTSSSSTISGYTIMRGGSQLSSTTGTSFMDTGLTPNTTYSYTLSAFDAVGSTSPTSAIVTATTFMDNSSSTASSTTSTATSTTSSSSTIPTAPINLMATGTSASTVMLSWNDGTNTTTSSSTITGYTVVRNGTPIASTTATSFFDNGLLPSTSYTYNVAALDALGNSSGWSNTAFGTTLAAATSTSQSSTTPPVVVPPVNGDIGWIVLPIGLYNSIFNATSTGSSSSTSGSPFTYINGYPTINGNYYDCFGNIDNDLGHHVTSSTDTDPAHHSGQNCPGGMPMNPLNGGSNTMPSMMGTGMAPNGAMWFGVPGAPNQWVVVPLNSQNLQTIVNNLHFVGM